MYRLKKRNVERVVESETTRDALINNGFEMIGTQENGTNNKEEESKSLEELTVKELKEIAKEKGIEGYSDMKREELLEVLE